MSTTPEPAKRHYGPAIPRWMLPTVHVRRQGDIVTVEQRVPARVESIHTSSRDDSSHNGHDEHHTPIYEAGLRRDLITHPNGASSTRGVTRYGRMGPPWPDSYDVAKRVRQGRRTLIGMTIFASVFLTVGVLIFLLFIATGQLTLIPLLGGVSVFGAILSHTSQQCDRLLVSYPSTMPGKEEPREISWEDVDTASLPAWCDARRRERYWNLAAIVFLIEFVVAILAIFASVMLNQTVFSTSSSSQEAHIHALIWNSALALVVIAAALATVVIDRRWIQQKDSELRHQAGLI